MRILKNYNILLELHAHCTSISLCLHMTRADVEQCVLCVNNNAAGKLTTAACLQE